MKWRHWKDAPRDGSPIVVLLKNNRCFDCRYECEQWVAVDGLVVMFDEKRSPPKGWIPFPEGHTDNE